MTSATLNTQLQEVMRSEIIMIKRFNLIKEVKYLLIYSSILLFKTRM